MIGEALVKHLSCIGALSHEDAEIIRTLKGEVRTLPKGKDIVSAGEAPKFGVIVLKGYLCRHSWKRDGARQIQSFYIPTDAASLETLHLDFADSNLGAVVPSTVGLVPHSELFRLMETRENVRHLIWRASLVQGAVFGEWLTRNSTLPAHAGLAHLFCEMFVRADAAGLIVGGACEMPTTQECLAQALGLTSVHVNRTLQLLRESGVIEFKNGRLYVHDFEKLAEIGEFDPHYLHLRKGRGSMLRRNAGAQSKLGLN